MPNWITNVINSDAPAIARILDRMKSDDHPFDFERLIKMPAHDPGSFYATGNLGRDEEHANPNGNWYDWACKFWGTKWCAKTLEVTPTEIRFDTAWGCPFPIMYALVAALPGVSFEWRWADEDIGSNLGAIVVRDGEIYFSPDPEDKRAFALSVKGWPDNYDDD